MSLLLDALKKAADAKRQQEEERILQRTGQRRIITDEMIAEAQAARSSQTIDELDHADEHGPELVEIDVSDYRQPLTHAEAVAGVGDEDADSQRVAHSVFDSKTPFAGERLRKGLLVIGAVLAVFAVLAVTGYTYFVDVDERLRLQMASVRSSRHRVPPPPSPAPPPAPSSAVSNNVAGVTSANAVPQHHQSSGSLAPAPAAAQTDTIAPTPETSPPAQPASGASAATATSGTSSQPESNSQAGAETKSTAQPPSQTRVAQQSETSQNQGARQQEPAPLPKAQAERSRQPSVTIVRNENRARLSALLNDGYSAYQRNDLGAARRFYTDALSLDTRSRDATLGLAAIAVRTGNTQAALQHYRDLLRRDPRDHVALAALSGMADSSTIRERESDLKILAQQNPRAPELYFALGTLYSNERRWPEAQGAFFEAHRRDAGNPDFMFNLAVALDHLNKKRVAREYYQRALRAADERAASFDLQATRARVQALREIEVEDS